MNGNLINQNNYEKNPYIKISKRKIGPDYLPVVIVELGINHKGSLKLAKKMVDAAIRAGAEIIKHQTHVPEDEMSLEAKKIIPKNANKNIYDLIKSCMLSKQEEKFLKNMLKTRVQYLLAQFLFKTGGKRFV